MKYILFLIIAIYDKKHKYIILTPDLTFIKHYKVLIYDKSKKVFSYSIRNKYDFITINEIYFHQSYEIKNLNFLKK